MSQVVYIDSDEEIISVISKLRKVADPDIAFVVPKRAVFLQSLVNLRLLDREAKKLKKNIVLVTPDETARALAEKAGIPVKGSLEGGKPSRESAPSENDLPARLSHVSSPAPPVDASKSSSEGELRDDIVPLHSESIGSSSFFSREEIPVARSTRESLNRATPSLRDFPPLSLPALPFGKTATDSVSRTVPVRDRTPKRLTALNSAGGAFEASPITPLESRKSTAQSPQPTKPVSVVPTPSLSAISAPAPLQNSSSKPASVSNPPLSDRRPMQGVSFNFPVPGTSESPATPALSVGLKEEKSVPTTPSLSQFYGKTQGDQASSPLSVKKDEKISSSSSSVRTSIKVFFGFLSLSVLVAGGVLASVFLPKAIVTVLTKDRSEAAEADVSASISEEKSDISAKKVPLRLVEGEKELSFSFPGTGKAAVSDKRARGMVTLSNVSGESPQSLVATTRLETPDGKIFRLVRGVTIPGSTEVDGKTNPGTIVAEAVADEAGEAYNVDPTTFSIPGFKGGSKYETITARSEKKFSGGGGGEGMASVSADDVAKAKESVDKKLLSSIRSELEKNFQPDEKLFDDAFQWETLSSGAFPGVGAVAPSFDYRVKVSVRALVVSEADIREVARGLFDGANVDADSLDIEYGVPRPDFVAKSMTIKIRVSARKSEALDTDSLKGKILGKTLEEVQGVFAEYPQIQKIEVVFWPKFMTSRIPNRASRVDITVRPTPPTP